MSENGLTYVRQVFEDAHKDQHSDKHADRHLCTTRTTKRSESRSRTTTKRWQSWRFLLHPRFEPTSTFATPNCCITTTGSHPKNKNTAEGRQASEIACHECSKTTSVLTTTVKKRLRTQRCRHRRTTSYQAAGDNSATCSTLTQVVARNTICNSIFKSAAVGLEPTPSTKVAQHRIPQRPTC